MPPNLALGRRPTPLTRPALSPRFFPLPPPRPLPLAESSAGGLSSDSPPAPRMSADALAPSPSLPALSTPSLVDAVQPEPLLRPPPIMKGDVIGVVAPSYSPRVGWLTRGVKALERAGFSVLLDPEITTLRRFTRAEDERRAENFMGMWLDPRVKGVIGGTGGFWGGGLDSLFPAPKFRGHPKKFVRFFRHTAVPLSFLACGEACGVSL